MIVSKVTYTGKLHTEAVHLASGSRIQTDAPVDNHGKGEAFSPTDLLSSSLACCMFTMMGIVAERHEMDISGSYASVEKIMESDPRRVGTIIIRMTIADRGLSEKQKEILEHTARTCPVLLSLSGEMVKELDLSFEAAAAID
ncbi:MAG: OsmC family protein [Chitinophagales bacterium]|nr:OsmC family protein [Chitinophagales bacterium]HAE13641.1 osmotically inducible protein OsmC [Bacteroidota bacterium]HQU38396.1 OsmC family protein [Chitinophagales bacterium]